MVKINRFEGKSDEEIQLFLSEMSKDLHDKGQALLDDYFKELRLGVHIGFFLSHMDEYGNVPLGLMMCKDVSDTYPDGKMVKTGEHISACRVHNGVLPMAIGLNQNLIQYGQYEDIEQVLYHEVIHFALHGIEVDNKDSDAAFQHTLAQVGVKSSEHIKMPIHPDTHMYRCTNCRLISYYDQAIHEIKGDVRSKCCHHDLKYIGQVKDMN